MYLEDCDLGTKAISVDKLIELLQSLKDRSQGDLLLSPNEVHNLRLLAPMSDDSYKQVGWVDLAWEEVKWNALEWD